MKLFLNELNGYFLALRRLGGSRCDYSVIAVKLEHSIEATIQNFFKKRKKQKIISQQKITYKEIHALFQEYIYDYVADQDAEVIRLFAWDIEEYYGLASTSSNGEFSPLYSGAIRIDLECDFHKPSVCFVVQIANSVVFTFLGVRMTPTPPLPTLIRPSK